MGSLKFVVAGGSNIELTVTGEITLAEAIKLVAEKSGVDLSGKDLRVNGAAATPATTVAAGDRVVAAPRPQGA